MPEQEKINIDGLSKRQPVVGGNIYDRGAVATFLSVYKEILDPMTTHVRMEMADAKQATRSHHRSYNEINGINGPINVAYKDIGESEIKNDAGNVIGKLFKVEILYPRATIQISVKPNELDLYEASKEVIFSAFALTMYKFQKDNYDFVSKIKDTILYSFSLDLEFDQTLKNREPINDLRRKRSEINTDLLKDDNIRNNLEKRSGLYTEQAQKRYDLVKTENELKNITRQFEGNIEAAKVKLSDLERMKTLLLKASPSNSQASTIKNIDAEIKSATEQIDKNELERLRAIYTSPDNLARQDKIQILKFRLGEISDQIKELRAEYFSIAKARMEEKRKLGREISELKADNRLKHLTLLTSFKDPPLQAMIYQCIEEATLHLLNRNKDDQERSVQKVMDNNLASN